jgi:2'-hydroxyisoflavone reductase
MVPGKIDDPVQYIDVRDVAEWMIRSAEEKRTGIYNVVGPKTKQHMPEFVAQAKEAFEVNSKLVQIDDYQFLKENGVPYLIPWILPEGNNYGSARVNNQKAVNAGLTFRAIKDSIHETFEWWESDALTEDRRNQFEQTKGSLLQREKAILERWRQHLKLKN